MVARKSIIPQIVAVQGNTVSDTCIAVLADQEITMLSLEQIERVARIFAVQIKPGHVGETITCEGFDVASLKAGDTLSIGDVHLKVTSIGRMNAFQVVPASAFPPLLQQHGIYLRVLFTASLCVGDKIQR